jgi:hypothetical protein
LKQIESSACCNLHFQIPFLQQLRSLLLMACEIHFKSAFRIVILVPGLIDGKSCAHQVLLSTSDSFAKSVRVFRCCQTIILIFQDLMKNQ